MSAAAYANLRPGGYYLISGFIDNQENDIIEHHRQTGFKLLQTCRIENWRAALLQNNIGKSAVSPLQKHPLGASATPN